MRADGLRLIRKQSIVLVLSVFILLICGLPRRAGAQEVTATINGTVTDPSGNVVANAEIKATDLDRGTTWPGRTNGEGFYRLSNLPVGRYEVRVTAPGFRTAVQSPVELQLNQIALTNVQLVVGQGSETVDVTSEAPLLQTESVQVGTVIDEHTSVSLPLASRNYLELTLLTPGAVTPSPSGFNSGKNSGETSRPEINGNRFTANDYVLDGMDNNQMSDNFVGYSPQPDAIQEFNLISQNAPADFGNYMGGIISATIKSGTNRLHGSAFEFFRNDALNANEWMNTIDPVHPKAKPALRWNQFGAAVGGPIIKNKLFFFADYEGERFNIPSSTSAFTVFTSLERQGNVSELAALQCNGAPCYTIKDPLTGLPFPGNVIPSNRLSPAAQAIINSANYPTPISGSITQNANNTVRTATHDDQGDLKIDYAMSEKDHFMGRYSISNLTNPTTNSYDFAYNPYSLASAWNFVLGYTKSLSPSMLNDARVGVNYVKIGQNHLSSNLSGSASSFGIAGLPTDILPAIQFAGNHQVSGAGGGTTVFGNKYSLNDYADTVIQYQDVFSYTHGKHNTRMGFQGWRLRMNGVFPGNSGDAGTLQFNGQYSGTAETDFLLGLPAQLGVGHPGPDWGQRGNIFGAFIQDDWKLTDRLTLNLGFRYEIHTPWYEAHDKQVNWDANTGALELPGQNGNPRALYDTYNGIGNYQPRLGIAYRITNKTVVRAGYSLSSFMEGTGQGLRLPQNPPSSTDTSIDYRTLSYPTTTLDQGFAGTTLPNQCTIAGLQSADPLCYNGAVLHVWDHKLQPAVSNQWNVFIERELSPSTTWQVGYVGQQTRHLTVAENLSQLQLLPNGTTAPSPFFADAPALTSQGILILATYSGANQNYNALQTSLKGRSNHGLSYLLSYTWSKCMTNSVGFFGEGGQSASQSAWWQNLYNPKGDYGACYFDVKSNFSGYVIYDLPFGRGRTWGSDMNRAADAILGGWRLSVIPTFRDGFPLTLGANDSSNTGSFAPRPECNGAPTVFGKKYVANGIQWFDPSVYSQPAAGTFGNCSVSSVRGPGEQNIDLGIAKTFPVRESLNVEFRTEFLNAFNHPILDAPNTGLGSNLGLITHSEGARNIQFGLKINF